MDLDDLLSKPSVPDADLKIKVLQRILEAGPKGRSALLQSFVGPITAVLASGNGAKSGYFRSFSTVRICQQVLKLCDGTEPGVDAFGSGFDRPRLEKLMTDALAIMLTPEMVAARKRAVEQHPEQALEDARVYAYVLGLRPKTEAERAEQARTERALVDALYN